MNRSENINEISSALAKAQSAMTGALKDSENPHLRSKYADLASVMDACRDALSSNGICYVQATRPSEHDEVIVETMLSHSSGQWLSSEIAIPVSKRDAQGFGSALTYARRYSLSAMVGVAPEDDDGNAAAQTKPQARKEEPKPQGAKAPKAMQLTPSQPKTTTADDAASVNAAHKAEIVKMFKAMGMPIEQYIDAMKYRNKVETFAELNHEKSRVELRTVEFQHKMYREMVEQTMGHTGELDVFLHDMALPDFEGHPFRADAAVWREWTKKFTPVVPA